MNRIDFIRSLILLFGCTQYLMNCTPSTIENFLLQCFTRGFWFYGGPKLLSEMRVGAMIQLKREPKNKQYKEAICIIVTE